MNTPKFITSFHSNERLIEPLYGEVFFSVFNVGKLIISSGKVSACDPLCNPPAESFMVCISPGEYSVILSLCHIPMINDCRTAYACLQLKDCLPVKWEIATCNNKEILASKQGISYGYGVDSGIGCFMDEEVGKLIDNSIYENEFEDSLVAKISDELDKHKEHSWMRVNYYLDASKKKNVIAFSTGWGDGIYSSYLGFDDENNLAVIVTDFELLEGLPL